MLRANCRPGGESRLPDRWLHVPVEEREHPVRRILRDLGAWSSRNLGCTAITPPWLSYYVEGCEQKLHSDVPHGPWAFVFSLSPRRPKFRGGETLLLIQLIDYKRFVCRIWIDGVCVWYYNTDEARNGTTKEVVRRLMDRVMAD